MKPLVKEPKRKDMNIEMILLDIPNGWKTAIMIVAMIAVFYLFLIRPQTQKAKKEQAYRDSLQKGDKLMTAGGIHVTFVSREGSMATVEAAPGARMKVQIGTLQPIPEHKEK
jgi:preprotein translocase subunit YajC